MAKITFIRKSNFGPQISVPAMPDPVEAPKARLAAADGFSAMALAAPPAYQIIPLTNAANTYELTQAGGFRINALDGNDTVSVRAGTGGNDYLDGGAGNDRLTAAETDDFLDGGAGTDTLDGGAGNDVLRGGAGADILTGGAGIDTADYSTSSAAVTITLALDPSRTARGNGGDAAGDTIGGIENLTGSAFNDLLAGNRLDNQLVGNGGNDTLRGNDGNDVLIGDAMIDVDQNGVPDDDDGNDVPDGVDTSLVGGNDLLDGGFGDDRLYGGAGDDTLIGSFGNDVLHGGYGNDLLTAGDGDDVLDGGEGDDDLLGSLGNDILRGGGGNDVLNGSLGDDILEGGAGNDDLNAGDGIDQLSGGDGDDIMLAGGGADTLDGGAGRDRLEGGDGADIMNGGGDDDVLLGGLGADQMDGGAGVDTADYSTSGSAVLVDLLNGVTSGGATGDTLLNIENIIGSGLNDALVGDGGNNTLTGGAGADQLIGQSGFDTADYSGSASGVTIQLNSTIAVPEAVGTGLGGDAEGDQLQLIERIIGSAFVDTLTGGELGDTFVGGGGADILNGAGGTDTAEYSTSSAAVVVSLDALATTTGVGGDAQGDQLTSIENLIGSALGDTLIGSTGANRLDGGAGDDYLRGGGGADRLGGGDGVDTADYSTSAAGVIVALVASDNPNLVTTGTGGDAAGDQLSQIENLVGSAFVDQLIGGAATNRLEGGAGNDLLRGEAGADILIGGADIDTASYSNSTAGVQVALDDAATTIGIGGHAQGDQLSTIENLIGSAFGDLLIGSASVNQLQGGAGDDTLRGGAGADVLVGGDGFDTADYSTSTVGVVVSLTANPASATIGSGGDAQGDQLNTMEGLIGSALTDQLRGSTASNKLVSGSGNDTLLGGSGADLLVANGTGTKTLFGDGVADGGVAGQDTFRILGGTNNIIRDYQTGEDLQLNSLNSTGGIGLGQINVGGTLLWAGRFVGSTHSTFVVFGPDQAAASAALNTLIQNDLFVDPGLIA